MDRVLDHRISRREFLAAGAAGGAAVLLGGAGSVVTAKSPAPLLDEQADWFEASIRELGRLMRRRELSSQDLTSAYL
ncbi:MAG: twin-arginine translocation signal domain-containing protein, partial [Candidatus Limnocylindrales bacterium]